MRLETSNKINNELRRILENRKEIIDAQEFAHEVFQPIFGDKLEFYPRPSQIKLPYKQNTIKQLECIGEINGLCACPIYLYDVTVSDEYNNFEESIFEGDEEIQEILLSDLCPFLIAFFRIHHAQNSSKLRFIEVEKDDGMLGVHDFRDVIAEFSQSK